MSTAKQGDTVRVHYTGKLESGEVFDSSASREPLEFILGEGSLIPGFEEAVVGMQIGEEKTVSIPAEEAYGPRRPEMALQVKRSTLPDDLQPQVGQVLQVDRGDDQGFEVVVTEVSDETVTLDANHPLAGKDLTFEIQLVEVV
ncbi:MAG: peptidylprolyl isomerase [Desulfuromonadales bacterium]|nr:peptidylprolyl isomerase [Desulfuromonadales bacterium]